MMVDLRLATCTTDGVSHKHARGSRIVDAASARKTHGNDCRLIRNRVVVRNLTNSRRVPPSLASAQRGLATLLQRVDRLRERSAALPQGAHRGGCGTP